MPSSYMSVQCTFCLLTIFNIVYLSLPIPTIMKMAPKLKLVNSAPQRIKRPNPEKVAIIVEITPAKPSHG